MIYKAIDIDTGEYVYGNLITCRDGCVPLIVRMAYMEDNNDIDFDYCFVKSDTIEIVEEEKCYDIWPSKEGPLTLKARAKVAKVLKNSSSPCFHGLRVGDIINFSTPIKSAGTGGHGTYATYIECYNQNTKETSYLSYNQLPKVLECCELKEIYAKRI